MQVLVFVASCSIKRVLDLAVDFAHAVFNQFSNETLASLSHNLLVLLPQLFDQSVLAADGDVSRMNTVKALWCADFLTLPHTVLCRLLSLAEGNTRLIIGVNHLDFLNHFRNLGLGFLQAFASVFSPLVDDP